MATETTRTRIARLYGEAGYRILRDALGPDGVRAAEAFRVSLTASAAKHATPIMLAWYADLDDEQVIADIRPHIEPDVRRRLAAEGKLPS